MKTEQVFQPQTQVCARSSQARGDRSAILVMRLNDCVQHLRYDDFAVNWCFGSLVMPIESALSQIKQITQWRKEIGLLERFP